MIKDPKNYRILVIEDNPGDLLIVEDLLMEQILAPTLIHASNFKQAAEHLQAPGAFFDVVLMDLTLPDKSGKQLIAEILNLAPHFPIIILTGYTDMEFSTKSIKRNISDYLLKDELNATTLYKSILYTIERNKYIEEIKKSEKRYSDLFRLSPQPMWVLEQGSCRFVQVNKAAIEQYGYCEKEFLNMTLFSISLKEDSGRITELFSSVEPGKEHPQAVRFRHHKKNGDHLEVEMYSTPITIGDNNCILVVAIDITDKILYEDRLIKAILKTQDEERYEIGSELHDNVCQILAASQISLDKLKDALPEQKMNWFNYCREYLALALNEIRNLSHRMAPAFLDDTTMEKAFRELLRMFDIDGRFRTQLHIDDMVKKHPISIEAQLNLYRILQEQLRNILKHAKASSITVNIRIHKDQLIMSISDNGVGFRSENNEKGIGLSNMQRRAEFFSGKMHVLSSPGQGCTINIEIPLQKLLTA